MRLSTELNNKSYGAMYKVLKEASEPCGAWHSVFGRVG